MFPVSSQLLMKSLPFSTRVFISFQPRNRTKEEGRIDPIRFPRFLLFIFFPPKGEEIAGEFKEKMKISVAKSVVSIPRLAASFLEDSRFFKISKVLGEEDISRDISGIILGTDVSVVAERGDTHTHIHVNLFLFEARSQERYVK